MRTILLASVLSFGAALHSKSCWGQTWHTTPDQWGEPRTFHSPYHPRFEDRVAVNKQSKDLPIEGRVHSPNDAYWFWVNEPNTREPGPWTTDIYVFNEREELIHIALIDHDDYERRFEWINEKLLYISIWWGRALGSYYIFDVEKEHLVVKEMMRDGTQPFIQWQQRKSGT